MDSLAAGELNAMSGEPDHKFVAYWRKRTSSPAQDPDSQAGRPGPRSTNLQRWRAWVTPGSCTDHWCCPAQLPLGCASQGECC
uniref:Uncharacterized protein n=1 Tax=Aotus nancymaae TaxID=37293 RepID=A0A2K5F4M2_AOTNA